MFKTILVPATGSDGDEVAFASALTVAKRFAAHLEFLHVRIDAAALAVAMTTDAGGPAMLGGLTETIDRGATAREERARQRVESFCRGEGVALGDAPPDQPSPSATWLLRVGSEPELLTEYGRTADLIVVGRPHDGEGLPLETIEAVLLDSGRPLLITAPTPMAVLPETVAIAWKPTREAARAVTAAMPLLSAARHVAILTVAEDDAAASGEDPLLSAALRRHGPEVSARYLPPGPHGAPDTLLAAASEIGALLVMGGYGHSRLREWIFGGFTRRALEGAEIPILIAH